GRRGSHALLRSASRDISLTKFTISQFILNGGERHQRRKLPQKQTKSTKNFSRGRIWTPPPERTTLSRARWLFSCLDTHETESCAPWPSLPIWWQCQAAPPFGFRPSAPLTPSLPLLDSARCFRRIPLAKPH